MILRDAFSSFQAKYPNVELLKQLQDSTNRVYVYRIANRTKGTTAYFAAKGSMNGGEVSIHEELFKSLKREERPIFIAVKSGDHFNFYKFTFQDIERDSRTNTRDGIQMVNFHIKHGESLQEERKHPVTDAIKKELQAEFVRTV